MANEQGIWRLLLTTRNEIPAAVEKNIQALNRLERKGAQSGSSLQRALSKASGGLGVGGALEGGGGIAASAAGAAAFAITSATRAIFENAMAMDSNAKRTGEAMKELGKYTDSTISSLAQLGYIFQGIKAVVGSMAAGNVSKNVNLGRAALGMGVDALMALPGVSGLLGMAEKKWPGAFGSLAEFARDQAARGVAGLYGDDLGSQATGKALDRLEEAKKRRKERDARRSEGISPRGSFSITADEYARMGLFIGGRSAAQETNQILRDQKSQLEKLNAAVDQLAPRIADNL